MATTKDMIGNISNQAIIKEKKHNQERATIMTIEVKEATEAEAVEEVEAEDMKNEEAMPTRTTNMIVGVRFLTTRVLTPINHTVEENREVNRVFQSTIKTILTQARAASELPKPLIRSHKAPTRGK